MTLRWPSVAQKIEAKAKNSAAMRGGEYMVTHQVVLELPIQGRYGCYKKALNKEFCHLVV